MKKIVLDKSAQEGLNSKLKTAQQGLDGDISGLNAGASAAGGLHYANMGDIGPAASQARTDLMKLQAFETAFNAYCDEIGQFDMTAAQLIEAIPELQDWVLHSGWTMDPTVVMQRILEKLVAEGQVKTIEDARAAMEDIANTMLGNPDWCKFCGDPINMSTGNFIYKKEDIALSGAFALDFTRFYNSIGNAKSTLGKGWTHNFNIALKIKEKEVRITFDDGHLEIYKEGKDGSFIPPKDQFNKLAKTESGYTLLLPSQQTYSFSADGVLLTIADYNGNITSLAYDNGLLIEVKNASGALSFAYNKDSLLEKITDHTGREASYTYLNKRLHSATFPNGGTYTYGYNAQGRLDKITNPLGITGITNEYDDNYRTTKQTFADGGCLTMVYDDESRTTITTEQNGNVIKYVKDDQQRTVKIEYDGSEESFEYDEHSKRTAFTNRNGNTTRFVYDKNGNVSIVTNPLGHTVELAYNEHNRPVKITREDGGSVVMEYDKSGNPVKTIDPLGNAISLKYNAMGLPVLATLPNGAKNAIAYDDRGNIAAITDAVGAVTRYEYDALNRVVKTVDANGAATLFEYDSNNNIIKETNALGHCRQFEYNAINKVTGFTDYSGAKTEYTYNALNKVERIADPEGGITDFQYDTMWNVAKTVDPTGAESKYTYNKLNRLEQAVDPEGGVTCYEYDNVGNVVGVTSPNGEITKLSYDACDRAVKLVEPTGAATEYEYDKVGNLVAAIDALGNIVKREYDLLGQLVASTNALNETTRYEYSPLGQVTAVIDAEDNATRYEYNLAGRMIKTTLPGGEFMQYSYDALGNVVKTTDALGNTTCYGYDPLGQLVTITNALGHTKLFGYDKNGNVNSATDENSNTTHYRYNKRNELIEVIDALGHSTKYDYDANGNLTRVEQLRIVDNDLADAAQINEKQITEYKRDKNGRIISATDPMGGIVAYSYDANGNIISKTDKDNSNTRFTYVNNKLASIKYADSREVMLSYNPLGQLIQMKDWLGITDIQVDALGRTTAVTHPDGKKIGYGYSSSGRRDSLTYPDGSEVKYRYSKSGNLESVLSRDGETEYTFDAMGRMTEKLLPNGMTTQYKIDPLNRINELINRSGEALLDKYSYTYDQVGNTTQIEKQREDSADNGIFGYSYDALNRLIEAQHNDRSKYYKYDSLGNRVQSSVNGKATSYAYNSLNQLLRTSDGQIVKEYNYDPRGNIAKILVNGAIDSHFSFNAMGMLEKAITTKGNAEYSYNGFGKRTSTKQIIPDNPERDIQYILDPTLPYNDLLATIENGHEQSYTWGNGLIAANDGTKSQYYFCDNLGSPIRLADLNGNASKTLAYDEFGVPEPENFDNFNGMFNPFGFTGYQHDNVTGLDYAQARFYQPDAGRFVSEDLIRGFIEIPQSINHYQYCINNPNSYIDFDGQLSKLAKILITGAALVAIGAITVATCGAGAPLVAVAIGAVAGAGISIGLNAAENISKGEKWHAGALEAGLTGAVSGALAVSPIGIAGQAIGNTIISGTQYAWTTSAENQTLSGWAAAISVGMVSGLSGGVGFLASVRNRIAIKYTVRHAIPRIVRPIAIRAITRYAIDEVIESAITNIVEALYDKMFEILQTNLPVCE